MAGNGKHHWEGVHESKDPDQASWWETEPTRSLRLIEASGVSRGDPFIDVGAGASTLVDHMLAAGYRDLTVLDLSGAALERVRARLGGQAVIATFGPDGPERCSGLEVERYSPAGLSAELGDTFELLESVDDIHRTPWGAEQAFVFCRFRRANL